MLEAYEAVRDILADQQPDGFGGGKRSRVLDSVCGETALLCNSNWVALPWAVGEVEEDFAYLRRRAPRVSKEPYQHPHETRLLRPKSGYEDEGAAVVTHCPCFLQALQTIEWLDFEATS
ncbi:hypothetical protein RRF57_007786 [Xylaria bambusicola]|uniref:Uncharacterized protein n=1 Tax=Xylaria bambusicola TaxID=326684 RepID=A0AAN7Z6K1_9PEZI